MSKTTCEPGDVYVIITTQFVYFNVCFAVIGMFFSDARPMPETQFHRWARVAQDVAQVMVESAACAMSLTTLYIALFNKLCE